MGTKRYELTESEWNRIKDTLPQNTQRKGNADIRQNGITAVDKWNTVDCQRRYSVERTSRAVHSCS